MVWERGRVLRRKSASSAQHFVSKGCRGAWKQAWFNLEMSPVDCDSLAAISMFGEERAQTFMKGPSNVVHRVDEVVCYSQRHREHFTGREINGFSETPANSARNATPSVKRLKLTTGWWRMTLDEPQSPGQTSGGACWKPAHGSRDISKWKHRLLFPFLLIERYKKWTLKKNNSLFVWNIIRMYLA